MRRLPLLALGVALLAGCTSPQTASMQNSTNEVGLSPGLEIVPLDAPPMGAPYEFTSAILADGILQHPRLDAQTQATIRWWNVDDQTHSIVSDDGMFTGSGPIPSGGEFAFTFQRAGDYTYHCRYHSGMTGIVVVR